jgi:hypothetical protein
VRRKERDDQKFFELALDAGTCGTATHRPATMPVTGCVIAKSGALRLSEA